jgi:exosortase O
MLKHRYVKLVATLAANLAILVLWAWLYRPVYTYLRTIFTRQEFRTNQIVLLGVLALIVLQARRGQVRLALGEMPQLHPAGLSLALAGSVGFIAAERWLDINTLSATLFGLASYGLLGLWMEPRRWRRGLPAALLLTGALPFGEHLETFVGFPLRLATARTVSEGLAALRVPNTGGGHHPDLREWALQVDSPCSGVKSLWTGGLFLLAATWIEARPVNRRWLLVAVSFALLLVAANLARVALLVLIGQVAGWHLVAEMLHVPLGIIGFTAACLVALGMLHWTGPALDLYQAGLPEDLQAASPTEPARPRWLAPVLVFALVGLVALYTPRARAGRGCRLHLAFPARVGSRALAIDSR